MDSWGYVLLAYGIVWAVIISYLVSLKRRYLRAKTELARLRAPEDSRSHGQK